MDNAAEKQVKLVSEKDKKKAMLGQLDEIKQQIKNMILKKREAKRNQLEMMQKFSGRKKKDFLSKIQQLKMTVAADVLKSHRKGDMSRCMTKDNDQICKYCEEVFKEDAQAMSDCKDQENFCFMCCENEFGSFYQSDKEKCMDQCDDNSAKGSWVWVPSSNQVK